MAKIIRGPLAKKNFILNPHKVKELRDLLKADTESAAVRLAIDEAIVNRRVVRSLNAFLDALSREDNR